MDSWAQVTLYGNQEERVKGKEEDQKIEQFYLKNIRVTTDDACMKQTKHLGIEEFGGTWC